METFKHESSRYMTLTLILTVFQNTLFPKGNLTVMSLKQNCAPGKITAVSLPALKDLWQFNKTWFWMTNFELRWNLLRSDKSSLRSTNPRNDAWLVGVPNKVLHSRHVPSIHLVSSQRYFIFRWLKPLFHPAGSQQPSSQPQRTWMTIDELHSLP